jgi:hypothetical protein
MTNVVCRLGGMAYDENAKDALSSYSIASEIHTRPLSAGHGHPKRAAAVAETTMLGVHVSQALTQRHPNTAPSVWCFLYGVLQHLRCRTSNVLRVVCRAP